MNKKVVKKLIKQEQVTQQEILEFITDYIEFKKKPVPTSEQLIKILNVIQLGIFSLNDAILESAKELNLEVNKLINVANGEIIKIYIYDN